MTEGSVITRSKDVFTMLAIKAYFIISEHFMCLLNTENAGMSGNYSRGGV